MMRRRDLLRAIAGGAVLATTGSRAAGPPNFVIFLADDMTVEQLGRMPQVQKLIGGTGITFLNGFVATPICQPARATMLTGQFSHNHGIISNTTAYTTLNPATCLQRSLQIAGYKTCHVGKFLNTYLVTDNGGVPPIGWDEWHAISPQNYYNYSINDNGVATARGSAESDYHTTVCTDRAISFINAVTPPFEIQICYKAPHFQTATFPASTPGNYTVTPNLAYSGVVPNSRLFPRDPNFNALITNPPAYLNIGAMDAATVDAIDDFWRRQTETLFALDRSVQAVVAALSAVGKLANTYLIFTSDNGYMHGEHRDPWEKYVTYLSSIRVPLLISGPTVAAGACSQMVSHVDIATTIYALSGATPLRTPDGVSLAPLFANPQGAPLRSALLTEFGSPAGLGYFTAPVFSSLISMPTGSATPPYIYTEYPATSETELYDLLADSFQLTNQTGNSAYAATKAALAAQLAGLKTCSGGSCVV